MLLAKRRLVCCGPAVHGRASGVAQRMVMSQGPGMIARPVPPFGGLWRRGWGTGLPCNGSTPAGHACGEGPCRAVRSHTLGNRRRRCSMVAAPRSGEAARGQLPVSATRSRHQPGRLTDGASCGGRTIDRRDAGHGLRNRCAEGASVPSGGHCQSRLPNACCTSKSVGQGLVDGARWRRRDLYSAVSSGGLSLDRRGLSGPSMFSTSSPSRKATRTSPPLVRRPNSNSSASGFLMCS